MEPQNYVCTYMDAHIHIAAAVSKYIRIGSSSSRASKYVLDMCMVPNTRTHSNWNTFQRNLDVLNLSTADGHLTGPLIPTHLEPVRVS